MINEILKALRDLLQSTLNEYALQDGADHSALQGQAAHLENHFFPALKEKLQKVLTKSIDAKGLYIELMSLSPQVNLELFADQRGPLPLVPDAEEPDDKWITSTNSLQARLEAIYRTWIATMVERIAGRSDRTAGNPLRRIILSGDDVHLVRASLAELEQELNTALAEEIMNSVDMVDEDEIVPRSRQIAVDEINTQKAIIATSLIPEIKQRLERFLRSPQAADFDLTPLTMSLNSLIARVASYAGSAWLVLNKLQGFKSLREGKAVFWNIDPAAKSCSDCLAHANKEYKSYSDMLAATSNLFPGSPDLLCAPNCRCQLNIVG